MGAHGVAAHDPGDVTTHLAAALTADRPTLIHLLSGRNH